MNGQYYLGQILSVEVNYDPDLFVGLTVYNDSGPTIIQLGGVIPMININGTLWRVRYTPPSTGTYLFKKAVYQDSEFTLLDDTYAQSSESVVIVPDLTTLLSYRS